MQLAEPDLTPVDIKVIDTRGHTVISARQAQRSDGTKHLDMQKLASGVYQVVLAAPGLNYSVPILKL